MLSMRFRSRSPSIRLAVKRRDRFIARSARRLSFGNRPSRTAAKVIVLLSISAFNKCFIEFLCFGRSEFRSSIPCFMLYVNDIPRPSKAILWGMSTVVARFAPSPTGPLHVGGARTALISYLYARQNGGRFLLRIEDTDRERSKPEYEKDIRDGLDWLGIRPDEEYRQSDRVADHTRYLKMLIEKDAAYVSREPKKEGGGEIEIVRFRNPNKRVSWTDMIRGDVSFDTTELKDFVISKSL